LFIAVYSEIDTPEGFANFVNTLAADGPAAVVEKFKESDPEAYKDAAQKVERLSPEDVKEIGKKIAAQARSFANDKMKEWESLDVPKPSELNWLTDFEAAKKQATAENKPMFVLFTGSDWCPWCIKLERELLSSPEFGKYAKDNLVMVMVDFPRGKEIAPAQAAANQKLSEQYNVSGFPTVLLMNAEGKVIGESGYEKLSPQKYVESVKKILNKK
ncbi:MAG: thioredoxin family protein, partial [Victivallaceae bacterium]